MALPLIAGATVILGMRRFGGASWPLEGANIDLVVVAIIFFTMANLLRASAWQKLFPKKEQPTKLTLITGVATSGASAPFLPARLDCAVKVAVINRLQPNIRIATVGISLISLGLAEFAAMFPVTALAALTSRNTGMQIVAGLLSIANLGACVILIKEKTAFTFLSRFTRGRVKRAVTGVSERLADTQEARKAVIGFAGCWALRAGGTWALMAGLGLPGLTHLVFVYLALGALSCALPISPGGAAMSIGAGTAILLGCGVSGHLASTYATTGTVVAFSASLATLTVALIAGMASALAPRFKRSIWPALARN
jgi:hypothetical protein